MDKFGIIYIDILFLQMIVDELNDFVTTFEWTNIPTIVFIKNGNVLKSIDIPNRNKILQTIESNKCFSNESTHIRTAIV